MRSGKLRNLIMEAVILKLKLSGNTNPTMRDFKLFLNDLKSC